jgi:hypothetical protein
MNKSGNARDQLLDQLGYKPLNRVWAKIEILFGLTAAGGGLLLGGWSVVRAPLDVLLAGAGLLLFVLGSYLALAGNRSHLYQSNNELVAYLVEEIHREKDRG